MLAWKLWNNGVTPRNSFKKSDHFIGDFICSISSKSKKRIRSIDGKRIEQDEALKESSLHKQVVEMLNKWESDDKKLLKYGLTK
jgi:hypothetical protein